MREAGVRRGAAVVPSVSGVDVPGTPGDDRIAGDVIGAPGDRIELFAGAGNADTGPGVDGEVKIAFNDTLAGLGGCDEISGDVIAASGGDVALSVAVGQGASFRPSYGVYLGGNGGDDARVVAFNDVLFGGGDRDTLVGDVLRQGDGGIRLDARVGNAGPSAHRGVGDDGGGGSGGMAIFANDRLFGGAAEDVLVGDVLRQDGAGDAVLSVGVGGTGPQGYFHPGSDGGSQNTIRAFNDRLFGGGADDVAAGDLMTTGSSGKALLSAEVGSGHRWSGGAGSDNRVFVFNDSVRGGSGSDVLAGDCIVRSSSLDVSLHVVAGVGARGLGAGDGKAGPDGRDGGDDCFVRGFEDTLEGGDGRDVCIGVLR
jgi:hypothetical protein